MIDWWCLTLCEVCVQSISIDEASVLLQQAFGYFCGVVFFVSDLGPADLLDASQALVLTQCGEFFKLPVS